MVAKTRVTAIIGPRSRYSGCSGDHGPHSMTTSRNSGRSTCATASVTISRPNGVQAVASNCKASKRSIEANAAVRTENARNNTVMSRPSRWDPCMFTHRTCRRPSATTTHRLARAEVRSEYRALMPSSRTAGSARPMICGRTVKRVRASGAKSIKNVAARGAASSAPLASRCASTTRMKASTASNRHLIRMSAFAPKWS